MKKALMIAIVAWFVLFSSNSFACDLCVELEKRGFSPESFNRTVSEYFGAGVKVSDSGKSFSSASGAPFNLAISKDGKLYPVTATKQLRGVVFDGSINTRPAKIFVVNGIDFVGIKTDKTFPILPAKKIAVSAPLRQPVAPIVTPHDWETTSILVPAQKAVAVEELKTTSAALPIKADQIIETSMNDAPTLLLPANRALQEQKEVAVKTERLARQAELKEKYKNQKLMDAGVTTTAIVTGLTVPVFGPFIAGGIILARVVYGLFQDNE